MPEIVDTPFADLILPCLHDGKTVYAGLAPLCDSMKLDAWTELRHMAADRELRDLVKTASDRPGLNSFPTLPIGGLALWLTRLSERLEGTDMRHRLAILQQEGFATLLDYWATRAPGADATLDGDVLKRQFKRLQSHICTVSDALRHGNSEIECEILRAQLDQLCRFPILPRRHASAILERFWNVVFSRLTAGTEINHARRADRFLALNFRHLSNVVGNEGADAIELTPELRTELKKCRQPNFLGVRVVNSRIAQKSLRCWVFNLH